MFLARRSNTRREPRRAIPHGSHSLDGCQQLASVAFAWDSFRFDSLWAPAFSPLLWVLQSSAKMRIKA